MADKLKNMIGLGVIFLLILVAGLWFFLAYQSEKPKAEEKKAGWVCDGKNWVKTGETDEKKPTQPCGAPTIKGPTEPPSQNK